MVFHWWLIMWLHEDKSEYNLLLIQFSSVQLLSRIRLFVTPGTTARQASNAEEVEQFCEDLQTF